MKIKRTEFVVLDPDTYDAVVSDVEVEEGEFGQQLKWKLALTDADGHPRELWAWCSPKLSRKSKLYGWASAILFGGRGVPDDYEEFDTASVVGRPCRVTVALKSGDRGDYNKVETLLPPRQARAKPVLEGTEQIPF